MTEATESAGEELGRRRPPVLTILVIAVVAVAAVAFLVFRREAVRAIEYSVSQDGRVLRVGADACKGDAQIGAVQTDEAVTIHATAERQWLGGKSICEIETLPVRLDEPLAERPVLDAYTGEPLRETSP